MYHKQANIWRIPSTGTLRCVALVRTDVSEERSTSIIRVTRTVEPGTLAATSNRHTMCLLLVAANAVPSSPILVTLMMEGLRSSETSVLTRATQHNIPEDGILHSHCHENLISYSANNCLQIISNMPTCSAVGVPPLTLRHPSIRKSGQ
jgi:hypothetical protein